MSSDAKQYRKLKGVVVSTAMDKTIVVRVNNITRHSKYEKPQTKSTNYKVHDENNSHKVGEVVEFIQCRPLSKHKRWRVLSK